MKVRLVFGTTNSQPVGTDEGRIEETYQRAYKPFLRASYNRPEIPITLHYSGYLLQWLDKHHSEFTDVLSEMGGRKQVELLGGAFYDPVLALIPRPDRLGQIERMTTHLRKRFGRRPRGAWITGQIWEPSLPSLLRTSGIDYTFLCDRQFAAGGHDGDGLTAPCITEDEGKTVVVFPVARELCEMIGVASPVEVIEALRGQACDDEQQLLSIIVDGERYAERFDEPSAALDWIRTFLDLLVENRDWIEVSHPWRYLRGVTPRRRAYFPPTSYREVVAPHLADSAFTNGHGGSYFRQFLATSPESNLMYAKMQYTHILVNQLRGDKYRKQLAREELWKGQCHTAYWNGRNGGIYENLLRKRVYSSLIEAEKVTREKGIFIPSVLSLDFDMDGLPEYLYQGHEINAYVHSQGGVLFELDYLPVPWNYLDTLDCSRASDRSVRSYEVAAGRAFVDHLLREAPSDCSDEDFAAREVAPVATRLYQTEQVDRDHDLIDLSLVVADTGLRIEKQFRFRASGLTVRYVIINNGTEPFAGWFGTEVNLGFLSDHETHLRVRGDEASRRPFGAVRRDEMIRSGEIEFNDLFNDVALLMRTTHPADVRVSPLVFSPGTRAQTSGGATPATALYQGTRLLPGWDLEIPVAGSWSVDITLALARL